MRKREIRKARREKRERLLSPEIHEAALVKLAELKAKRARWDEAMSDTPSDRRET